MGNAAFWSGAVGAAVGGLVSIGTTAVADWRTHKRTLATELRVRTETAVTAAIEALLHLLQIPPEPTTQPDLWQWADRRTGLISQFLGHALVLEREDIRDELEWIATALERDIDLATHVPEPIARQRLVGHAIRCLGAARRGDALQGEPERVRELRRILEQADAVSHPTAKADQS